MKLPAVPVSGKTTGRPELLSRWRLRPGCQGNRDFYSRGQTTLFSRLLGPQQAAVGPRRRFLGRQEIMTMTPHEACFIHID